jgi:hypothetical protein
MLPSRPERHPAANAPQPSGTRVHVRAPNLVSEAVLSQGNQGRRPARPRNAVTSRAQRSGRPPRREHLHVERGQGHSDNERVLPGIAGHPGLVTAMSRGAGACPASAVWLPRADFPLRYSLGRSACNAEGRGFESHQPLGSTEPFVTHQHFRGRARSTAGDLWRLLGSPSGSSRVVLRRCSTRGLHPA